jgi:hypothetical protein
LWWEKGETTIICAVGIRDDIVPKELAGGRQESEGRVAARLFHDRQRAGRGWTVRARRGWPGWTGCPLRDWAHRHNKGRDRRAQQTTATGAFAEIDGRPMATLKAVTLRGPNAAADG